MLTLALDLFGLAVRAARGRAAPGTPSQAAFNDPANSQLLTLVSIGGM